MNIFELAALDDVTVDELVNETLRRFPELRYFYDDAFVRRLIPRRRNLDNFLLLVLVQPDDNYPKLFWTSTIADLTELADEGAWTSFKPKFRRHEHFDLQSAKSELSLAAWLKRRGFPIELEPLVNGNHVCEFVAGTTPATWWEVKSLRDIDIVEKRDRVYLEVQHRLNRIREPYVISVNEGSSLALQDVAAAVRGVKKQIAAFYRAGGRPPKSLSSHGLCVEIESITKRSYGYLASTQQSFIFGSEQMERVLSRVSSSIDQLPEDGAGLVIIDATMATWLHKEDVIDACFGEEVLMSWRGGPLVNVRKAGGAFDARHRTRISAVAYFKRPADHSPSFEMTVLHNPYAKVCLPSDLLRAERISQMAQVDLGGNRYRLTDV